MTCDVLSESILLRTIKATKQRQSHVALFPPGKPWQNGPGSCCHPKIVADLKAGKELSDAPNLFTQPRCVCAVNSHTIPRGTRVHRWHTARRLSHEAAGHGGRIAVRFNSTDV